MLRISIQRIKPGKETRLAAWLGELMQRQDEVRETFAQESVRHETAYIIPGADGPLLVYAMELEDPEQARRAYDASTLPIDAEHRAVMEETLEGALDLDPLYDCALDR